MPALRKKIINYTIFKFLFAIFVLEKRTDYLKREIMETTKKHIATFALLLFASLSQAFSQDYRPMLQVGKTWYLNYVNWSWPDGQHDWKIKITIEKDTVIGGEPCFKAAEHRSFMPDKDAYYFMQEKDHRILELWKSYPSGKKLLFDFTLNEGDSVTVSEGSDMTVERIDTVDVQGELFRRFTMYRPKSGYYKEERQIWVEGIGGESSPLLPLRAQGDYDRNIRLDSCTIGGRCLFRRDDLYAPSYQANTDNIQGAGYQKREMPAFDMQGRRLSTPPSHGLYIRNGRKVLVR